MESDDLKKDLPLMPPPPDSSSMKLTIREIWFSFAAPTNVRSPSQAISRLATFDFSHSPTPTLPPFPIKLSAFPSTASVGVISHSGSCWWVRVARRRGRGRTAGSSGCRTANSPVSLSHVKAAQDGPVCRKGFLAPVIGRDSGCRPLPTLFLTRQPHWASNWPVYFQCYLFI